MGFRCGRGGTQRRDRTAVPGVKAVHPRSLPGQLIEPTMDVAFRSGGDGADRSLESFRNLPEQSFKLFNRIGGGTLCAIHHDADNDTTFISPYDQNARGEIIASNPRLAELNREILLELGEDPERQGLVKTPQRVANSLQFLTAGYRQNLHQIVNEAIYEEDLDEIVAVKKIHFFSLCEHHMLPFFGVCSVAYVPNGKIIGLSKIPRIVDMFARRLQVQERLTRQVAEAIQQVLEPAGVAVTMEAYHLCMMMRGVQKQDSRTVTSEMLGVFKDNPKTRQEFLTLMGWSPLAG